MWCACKIGTCHWEENFVTVDWQDSVLVAYPTEEQAENNSEGKVVCNLVGLKVELDEDELQRECISVTGGDYSNVMVLSPEGTEYVCVIGVEDELKQSWLCFIDNCISICNYGDKNELVQDLQSNPKTGFKIVLASNTTELQSPERATKFTTLFNSFVEKFSCVDTLLSPPVAYVLFNGFRKFWRLSKLQIRGCGLDEHCIGYLCKGLLSVSSRLEELDLSHNQIEDEGAMALSEALPCLSGLLVLKLGDNQIESRGGKALGVSLRRLSCLVDVELFKNDIGDAGVTAVASSLGSLPYLKNLILHDCGATGGTALSAIIKGLIANTNASAIGGIEVIDLQDNSFDSSAIKRFLTQCSGLGAPKIIKLGRKRRQGLVMAMEEGQGEVRQVVDLGFPDRSPSSPSSPLPPLVDVVFGSEISPFRVLSAITNLLDLQPGDVRIYSKQTHHSRQDNMQVVQLLMPNRDYSNELISLYQSGNAMLHLLHVADIQHVVNSQQDIIYAKQEEPEEPEEEEADQDPPVPVSVQISRHPHNQQGADGAGDVTMSPKVLETDLLDAVKNMLIVEDPTGSLDEMKSQMRIVARLFSLLKIFVPSEKSEIKRYVMEAKLKKVDQDREAALIPGIRRSLLSPLISMAVSRLCLCTASDVLIVRAYVAAMFGDVERTVSAAEQGKYLLGLMLSLSQVTAFESATLQASIVAQDSDMFALVMSQDLSEEEVASRNIRLASLINNDLFARSSVLHNPIVPSSEGDDADYAGLVIELLRFSRLNTKWSPRELRLQFTNQARPCPITRPVIQAEQQEQEGTYWKSLSRTRIEQAYVAGSDRICELLQQAMGDIRRGANDPDGYGAAHEAFGIAYSNRDIGLEDELICQLICQVTCNPSLRSLELGWRLIVLALRILEPSKDLCETLYQVFDGRITTELNPNRMVIWAQEALRRLLESTTYEKRSRRVFASDASIRLDLLRQVMCDDDTFDIDIHCCNGTGVKVKVSPFTSFEELLQQVHNTGKQRLLRMGGKKEKDDADDFVTEERWRDFAFSYTDHDDVKHIMSWETDAYWWRWEVAINNVLHGQEGENDDSNHNIKLQLELFVCTPTIWYLTEVADTLRVELVYWQRQQGLLKGELCSSNPEGLGFLCCLSSCIQISGGLEKWVNLDHSDQVRFCLGHLPKAVRKRVGKRANNPWVMRFTAAVERFSSHIEKTSLLTSDFEQSFSVTTLQRAYIAYLETWPLANGVIFRDVTLHNLAVFSNPDPAPLIHMNETNQQRVRFVLNSKGLFLLVLTHDSQTSRAVALQWWTPLDEIVRIDVIDGSVIQIETRCSDVVDFSCPDVRKFYKTIIAQCTANLAVANPRLSTHVLLVEFAHRFKDLPWPPAPPPLYDTKGNPVDLQKEFLVSMDLPTCGAVLKQLLLTS